MVHVLGIDIGGTNVKAGLVDDAGNTLASGRAPTTRSLEEFKTNVRGLLTTLLKDRPPVRAVGIGCKGIVDAVSTKVLTLPGEQNYLEGLVLADLIRPLLPPDCRVIGDNDARIAMAGEKRWGSARGCRDALLLTLGTGVGGGILSGGQIVRGAGAVAGHLGHFTCDPDGLPCICGNRGCLETIFSASALEGEAMAGIRRGLTMKYGEFELHDPSCEQIFGAARDGDVFARSLIERAVKYLGGAIAALLFLLDSEVVILTGHMIESADLFVETLRADVYQRTRPLLRRDVPIVLSTFSDPSGVLGAAALALETLA